MRLDFINVRQLSWVAVGVAGVGLATKFISSASQKKAAKKVRPEYVPYEESPYAKEQFGVLQNAYNAPMPGMEQAQQNIAGAQANFNNQVGRNATDSSQALALGGLSAGASNNAFSNLAVDNAKYKNDMLNNLMQGYQAMIGEGDKVYQSKMDKYLSDVQAKMALRNAAAQNFGSAINDAQSVAQYGNYYNWGQKK